MRVVMSGAARDLPARLLRGLTLPASWLFGLLARARLLLYRLGLKRSQRVDAPVICVGNLSTGGSGKTPVVVWIVRELRAMGRSPGVLSRGYRAADLQEDSGGTQAGNRGAAPSGNDEARMLAELLPKTPHVENPDRVAGARELIARGCDVIVLDDGFSHLRLARDLDVLLFDARAPFGYGHLLPRGLLREPLASSRRAGLAIITRSDQATLEELAAIQRKLQGYGHGRAVLARHAPKALVPLDASEAHGDAVLGSGSRDALNALNGLPVAAMCGIGNPSAFFATLEQLGAKLVSRSSLPDHFAYNAKWRAEAWPKLREQALAAGAQALVVTQKDAVKLRGQLARGVQEPPLPLYELRVEMAFDASGAAQTRAVLARALEDWPG